MVWVTAAKGMETAHGISGSWFRTFRKGRSYLMTINASYGGLTPATVTRPEAEVKDVRLPQKPGQDLERSELEKAASETKGKCSSGHCGNHLDVYA